ncbi:Dehydrogenase/reductase SDR family member 1 [Aphelenchoides avenae]|nr:Dehydrogenase/reductase SDR family member 1 [Aphelenchus avenae]
MAAKKLQGQIALVTGASRGIGKGIAVVLGQAGATVYVTGRPPQKRSATETQLDLPALEETAKEVTARGGKGIAVFCDHSSIEDVKKLFDQIEKEQNGRLDILVNNAYSAVVTLLSNLGKKFYELPVEIFDEVNNVGLRNHYVCSVYAARQMVPRKAGLIVTISSSGGINYILNTAYGVGKAAVWLQSTISFVIYSFKVDRLAADVAIELKDAGIVSISLVPGPVKTEIIQRTVLGVAQQSAAKDLFANCESIEFAGRCVLALATDTNIKQKTGKVLTTTELAKEYHLKDIDGTQPHCAHASRYVDFLDVLNKVRTERTPGNGQTA